MDAKHTLGEPRALISRGALMRNARLLRRHLAPEVKLCAMLKADAYGHGAAVVIDALCNFRSTDGANGPLIDAVGVASIDEAALLPLSTPLPVIVFRPVENTFLGRQRDAIELAVRSGWTLTVCTAGAADDVARIALNTGKRASVQVMVDTGMTRCGAPLEHSTAVLQKVIGHASLKLHGVCTHFANAEDATQSLSTEQLARFHATIDPIFESKLNGHRPLRHAANSGGAFFVPASHLDMVRPGIALFGIDPTGRPSLDRALRPALRWTAPLIAVRDLSKGAAVGYGQTWRAPRETRIGLVPVGYADGYWRSFSNRAVMVIGGKLAPVVGRVSMDLTTVDLGDSPHTNVGDEVTILDADPLSPCSVYKLAQWAETIPYEIFCRIGARIRRIATEPDDSETTSRIGGTVADT
jgi:alanine racemase